MGIKEDYDQYAILCERTMEHVRVSIDDYLTEIELSGQRSPIVSISSRIKTFDSVKDKCKRRKIACTINNIRNNVNDVAGIRIVTLFKDDILVVAEAIKTRLRLHTVTIKDYIEDPKDNGYQSLHLLVQREIYFNGETSMVPVEVQIRSKAMDLWASVEHVVSYKNDCCIPEVEEQFKQLAELLTAFDESAMKLRDSTSTP